MLVAVGWASLANAPLQQGQTQAQSDKGKPAHSAVHSLEHAPRPESAEQHCKGTAKPDLDCDAIAAQAALDQAGSARQQSEMLWPQFILGIFTLLAAVGAAVFAKKAAVETERSAGAALAAVAATNEANGISRDTAKRQLRAYVTYEEMRRVTEITNEPPAAFSVIVRNTGQTPARFVYCKWQVECIDPADLDDFAFKGETQGKRSISTLAVNGVMSIGLIQITQEIARALLDGQTALVAWGAVDYNDVFPDTPRRRTEFALELELTQIGGNKMSWSWRLLDRHNAIDDDCVGQPEDLN